MASLAQRAEVLKLARLLGTPPGQLEYLHKLDALAIRKLRQQASASLFDADHKLFQRIATASRLLPAAITALIAEKAMGPLLCARTTGLMPPDRAVEISKRLHTGFLADLCVELDPRSARAVLFAMPVDRIVEVARELARRKEYITMGRFVDSLSDEAIVAIMADLEDDEALLRIGFFVEDVAHLNAIMDVTPLERLRNIVRLAVDGDAGLWPETLAMINAVGDKQRRLLVGLAAELDDRAIGRMISITQAQGLWPSMLPAIAAMDSQSQKRLIDLPALQDEAVLDAIIQAADAGPMWTQLLPLVAMMGDAAKARVLRVAKFRGAAITARLTEFLRLPSAHADPVSSTRRQ